MKILHVSDSHGLPPAPPDEPFDVIVHSGDFCPSRSFGDRIIEPPFQTYWCEAELTKLHPRYWGVPVIITPGNHDYVDVSVHMRAIGIDARRAVDELVEIDGVRFWGHPWMPTFYDWNWMCGPEEMRGRLGPARARMEDGEIDVLVSHGPMYGLFDRNRERTRCGCMELREAIDHAKYMPKALLHGHIHEANAVGVYEDMIVSNAAVGQRIVEIP